MESPAVQRPLDTGGSRPSDSLALCDFAIAGLQRMFDPQSLLFCHRRRLTPDGMIREGLSRRYTMMTLLGLHRYAIKGQGRPHPFDATAILDNLRRNTGWINNLGDLGLLLWTCAETAPRHLVQLCSALDLEGALDGFPDGQQRKTMELSWFLTGLAEAKLAYPEVPVAEVAARAYRILERNQGNSGVFGHSARSLSLSGRLRGRIGSFADQVYPICALVRAHLAFHPEKALDHAKACGEGILRSQGPLGQWWWHYDSVSGAVVEQYPVYSVHQDAMAPMALFALEEVCGCDVSAAVMLGLRWITGANEMIRDLRNPADKVIWRSVYHRYRYRTLFRKGIGYFRGESDERTDDLAINFEDRPYHFGWLLYAISGRQL